MSGYTYFSSYYDSLTQNIDYQARGEYFDQIIRRHQPQPGLLLDLACGTGSLSLVFAQMGYDVIGVDLSQEMLSVAWQKAADAAHSIQFLRQSMDKLDLYGTVDATVCALDSLNHVMDEKLVVRAFERVALFSNPGALFVFDVNTPYKHRECMGDNVFVFEQKDLYCVWQNQYDPQDPNHKVTIQLDFFQQRQGDTYLRSSERFSQRIYSESFFAQLLEQTGFQLLNIYGEDSFAPPTPTAQRLVYVAQKKGI